VSGRPHAAVVIVRVTGPVDVATRQAVRRALEPLEPGLRTARGAVVRTSTAGTQLRWRVLTGVRPGHDPEGAWSARLALAAWTFLPVAAIATLLTDGESGRRYAWRWTPGRRSDAERHAVWRPFEAPRA
jgi:hypothetical protein